MKASTSTANIMKNGDEFLPPSKKRRHNQKGSNTVVVHAQKVKKLHVATDTLREVLRFINLGGITQLSLVNRLLSRLSEPLRHILSPRFIEPLMITGTCDGHQNKCRGSIIQFRDKISGKRLEIPMTEPPQNIISFEFISISDYLGPETIHFLKVCKPYFAGCSLEFRNLSSFFTALSDDLIDDFLSIFTECYVIHISQMYWRLENKLNKLFLSNCNRLNMCISGNFDFSKLIDWLHLRPSVSRFLGLNARSASPNSVLCFNRELIDRFLTESDVKHRFMIKLHSSAPMPEYSISHPNGDQLRIEREYLEENYSYTIRRYNIDEVGDDNNVEVFWSEEDEQRCKIVIGAF